MDLGCTRTRLERCPCNIERKGNKFTYFHCDTTCVQAKH